MDPVSYSYLDTLMTKDDEVFFRALGKRIAQQRKEIGLTQVQLAELLSISQQHMAAFEAGRRKVSAAAIPVLAKLFGMTTDQLMGIDKQPAKRGPASRLQQKIEQVSRMPKAKQQLAIDMLEAIIQQQSA